MKPQSQQTFLRRLKTSMLLQFSRKEICDVLEDYQSFFEAGKADGRSEEALCQEFGNPKDIVKSMMSQQSAVLHDSHWFLTRNILKILLMILLFVLSLKAYWINYTSNHGIIYQCLPVLIVPLCLWYLLGGFSGLSLKHKSYSRRFICLQSFLFLLALMMQYLTTLGMNKICNYVIETQMDLSLVGPLLDNFSRFFLVTSVLLLLYSLYQFYLSDFFYFGMVIQAVGLIFSSLGFSFYLRHLSVSMMHYYLFPYGASLLLSITYYCILFTLIKQGSTPKFRKRRS